MLTFIYNYNFYKFIKSGLLIDFYFKRIIYFFLKIIYFVLSNLFGEKYIVEHIFLKLNKFSTIFYKYLNKYSINFSYLFLSLM